MSALANVPFMPRSLNVPAPVLEVFDSGARSIAKSFRLMDILMKKYID